VQVHRAAGEAALAEQHQRHADVVGEGARAAAHHDRHEEQVQLVDLPRPDRLAGEVGPPTVMSRSAVAFRRRTASGSSSRSIRVPALATAASVLEYTTLSAARQISAKSRTTAG